MKEDASVCNAGKNMGAEGGFVIPLPQLSSTDSTPTPCSTEDRVFMNVGKQWKHLFRLACLLSHAR